MGASLWGPAAGSLAPNAESGAGGGEVTVRVGGVQIYPFCGAL